MRENSRYEVTYRQAYRGHDILVYHHIPDFIAEVDGSQLGFFASTQAGIAAGQKMINRLIAEKEKQQ